MSGSTKAFRKKELLYFAMSIHCGFPKLHFFLDFRALSEQNYAIDFNIETKKIYRMAIGYNFLERSFISSQEKL